MEINVCKYRSKGDTIFKNIITLFGEIVALAYNKAALKYHGEFAKLNSVEGGKSDVK